MRSSPPAVGRGETLQAPKGPDASSDSSQDLTPSKDVLVSSKKKYRKFDRSPPMERDQDQSTGPVASQAHSPACSRTEPQRPAREGAEAQDATPSGFGIPLATLPEAASTEARPPWYDPLNTDRAESMTQPGLTESMTQPDTTEESAPSPADWQGHVLSGEDVQESFDKTLSPGISQGEQEEYEDELDLTETPSGEQEYHAFSDPSTEESREKIEVPPVGPPCAGGAEPSSDSIVDLDSRTLL